MDVWCVIWGESWLPLYFWDDPSQSLLLLAFHTVAQDFRSWWRWEDRRLDLSDWHQAAMAWERHGKPARTLWQDTGIVFGWCPRVTVETVVWGMEQVALSPSKPRGSSLVPLHMTWLSRFESISSSTLACWTPAKEAGSRGGAGAGVRGIMWYD